MALYDVTKGTEMELGGPTGASTHILVRLPSPSARPQGPVSPGGETEAQGTRCP